ncbi:hypothetical protein [Butyrivibrio sp. MC2021]|uniref:hypothetical protein n=1 Tax=Butyrivibrio sp. MC2021 TaxID=1408306 RepID=UPI0012DF3E27|nr:hypothetical protein [Butyrivibrio sp. MC2021]
MRFNSKKILVIMLAVLLMLPVMGAGSSGGKVKLDLDDYHAKNSSTTIGTSGTERSIADGDITFRIPDSMTRVDDTEIFNKHISDEKDGEMYLDGNALFGIFYFDNDYFVDVPEEKDETNAIERAIISNICPSEEKRLKWNSLTLRHYFYPTSQSKSLAGLNFHHYVGKYENFRVEFAFTPTDKGICVILFIYNHDGTKADAAISVMESLRIK